ncbi:helix-turn-helix domain-containing protein, partial [Bacillus sp. D-CC]
AELAHEADIPKGVINIVTGSAKERGLSRQTIENHLIRCFEDGMEVDWNSFVPAEYEQLIETAVQNADGGLKSIKEQLPNEVSYFMIRAYLQIRK